MWGKDLFKSSGGQLVKDAKLIKKHLKFAAPIHAQCQILRCQAKAKLRLKEGAIVAERLVLWFAEEVETEPQYDQISIAILLKQAEHYHEYASVTDEFIVGDKSMLKFDSFIYPPIQKLPQVYYL